MRWCMELFHCNENNSIVAREREQITTWQNGRPVLKFSKSESKFPQSAKTEKKTSNEISAIHGGSRRLEIYYKLGNDLLAIDILNLAKKNIVSDKISQNSQFQS